MNRSESKYFNTARRMDEALLSLLEEKDFAYITVREICARAGVNRSTFYLHYESMVRPAAGNRGDDRRALSGVCCGRDQRQNGRASSLPDCRARSCSC